MTLAHYRGTGYQCPLTVVLNDGRPATCEDELFQTVGWIMFPVSLGAASSRALTTIAPWSPWSPTYVFLSSPRRNARLGRIAYTARGYPSVSIPEYSITRVAVRRCRTRANICLTSDGKYCPECRIYTFVPAKTVEKPLRYYSPSLR